MNISNDVHNALDEQQMANLNSLQLRVVNNWTGI